MSIAERIQAAITPVLARADRLLWELENPRTVPGRREHPRGSSENANPV
jgi:hypothetical protein